MSLEGTLAANRFGLGAKPGEIDTASNNPKAWLLGQLRRDETPDSFSAFPNTADLVQDLRKRGQAMQAMDRDAISSFLMDARQTYLQEMAARFRHGFITDAPFRERLVRFWSNHFVVSIQKPRAARFVGAFERDAIRAHVTGRFSEMVLAVERHPAMQIYLDNAQSIGPNSFAGKQTGKGLNENLGREILELHTLGVDGGYKQDDVIALAKILTGWSLDRGPGPAGKLVNTALGGTAEGGFRFYPPRHEPGDKVLLGKTYGEGLEGGIQALTDLANHPATARHIATKIAAHFIADTPPEASVKRLETAFRDSGGDLMKVYEALIDDPAAWRPDLVKFRTPVEFVTAAMRIAGGDQAAMLDAKTIPPIIQSARAMGEAPFSASSPKGWPDEAAAWTGADAILQRVEWANTEAERLGMQSDPVKFADEALGSSLTKQTRTAISRAASPAQGLALLFASPEFQRR